MNILGFLIDASTMSAIFALGIVTGVLWERPKKQPLPPDFIPEQLRSSPPSFRRESRERSPYAPKLRSNPLPRIEPLVRSEAVAQLMEKRRAERRTMLPAIDWGRS